MDSFPAAQQRPALIKFARALKSRENALRRDRGEWIIRGSRGSIAAVAGGFAISFDSATPWRFALATMDFAEVVRDDGESGGVMLLARHPTEHEAATIRVRLGIAKATLFNSPSHSRRLKQRA